MLADAGSGAVADPQAAPVAAAHQHRSRRVLHERELPATHVAPVALDEEGGRVPRSRQPHPVVERAPVAAVGLVPRGIGALALGELGVVGWQGSERSISPPSLSLTTPSCWLETSTPSSRAWTFSRKPETRVSTSCAPLPMRSARWSISAVDLPTSSFSVSVSASPWTTLRRPNGSSRILPTRPLRSRSALARALTGSGRASATARVNDSEEGGGPPAQRGAQAPHVRRQSPEPDDGERVQDDISTGDQASHGAVSVHLGFIQLNAA
jgi:hypothetical protein